MIGVSILRPDTPHIALIQTLEVIAREAVIDNGDAAIAPIRPADGIKGHAVIGTVPDCLDDHRALYPERLLQHLHGLEGRIGRRIAALLGEGKFGGRAENTTMGIAGLWRCDKDRYFWCRAPAPDSKSWRQFTYPASRAKAQLIRSVKPICHPGQAKHEPG